MKTKEETAAYHKKWQAANPDKLAAYNKRWRAENSEKAAAACKQWNAANPDKLAASSKKWAEANPEKYAASKKATKAKAVENLTDGYVSSQLSKRKGMHQTAAQLREYPEIIDCYRAIMKLRRICRIKNKEKL